MLIIPVVIFICFKECTWYSGLPYVVRSRGNSGQNEIGGKMRHFLFHNEFSVCPVEKQISSICDVNIELLLSAFQSLFLW